MALEFNFGNPNESMAMSLQGLRDYYATIDDPARKALEIRKGYNQTLGNASAMQNTSNRMGAKIGNAGAMNDKAGYRDNSFGLPQADETKQLVKMQQTKDAIGARLKGMAMAGKLAGQQGELGLKDAEYYQQQQEDAGKKLLEEQKYMQAIQDIATREAEQKQMLDLDASYQPSGWERFGASMASGAGSLGGYALGNYLSQPSETQYPSLLSDYWNQPYDANAAFDMSNYFNQQPSLGDWSFGGGY
jgi:hypothetical protein